jgi:hypothetical protein
MRKKAIIRGLLGFPLGIAMGYVITIIISLIRGDGYYSPVVYSLIDEIGNEISAVVVQTVLCGLLGAISSAISVIWEVEHWSIFKQSGLYFLGLSAAMLPIAYFTHWMERTFIGFISYFAVFTAFFVVIWIVQYLIWKSKINDINKKV